VQKKQQKIVCALLKFSLKLAVNIAIFYSAINNKRRTIIACCGNGKCSTAYSKVLTGRKNSSSGNKNKNAKRKNSTGAIGPNGNGKVRRLRKTSIFIDSCQSSKKQMPATMQGIGAGTYSTRSGAKGGSQDNPAIAKNPTGEGGSASGHNGNSGNSGSGAENPSGGNSGADQSSDPSDQGEGGQAAGDENGAGNYAATSGAFVNPAGSGKGTNLFWPKSLGKES
jgi:hypothetical protein